MSFVSSRYHRSPRGFTLIELLVAIGVTAILVTLMLTITLSVLNAWNRSSGKLSANATARLALDQLAQDLGAVIMRRDGNVWLAATVQRDQTGGGDTASTGANWSSSEKPGAGDGSLVVDEAQIADLRFGQAGVWLRYFVAQPDTNNAGLMQSVSAPRGVSFQIIRRNLGSATSPQYSYQLFRAEVRPYHSNAVGTPQARSTFGTGYDLYASAATAYNGGSVGNENDATNIRNPRTTQLIGNDVVDFGVRFYERNRSGDLVEVFPVNRRDGAAAPTGAPFSYAATSDVSKTLAGTDARGQTYGFPVEAELMVRVLTPEGVRLLQSFEEDTSRFPGQTWWGIVIKNSDVFTRRVEIKSTPL